MLLALGNKLLLFFISLFLFQTMKTAIHKKGWCASNFQETVNLIKRRIWQSISPRWDIYHHQVMNIIFCNPIKTSATKKTVHKNYKPTSNVHRFGIHVFSCTHQRLSVLLCYSGYFVQSKIKSTIKSNWNNFELLEDFNLDVTCCRKVCSWNFQPNVFCKMSVNLEKKKSSGVCCYF